MCPDFVEIESIEFEDKVSDVYDITVEETHNFFADGMLVHNCIGGLPSFNVFQELQQHKFDDLNQSLLNDPTMLERCITAVGNSYDLMTQCVGEGNYYLELQFNKLPAQNLVNRAIIEFARRNGVTKQLVVTCDAHYYNPDVWKERELYKKLGFMNYQAFSPDSLPKSKDELKCELYPKNASQVWDEYLRSKAGTEFYDDDLVRDAIERTHDIAHQIIGELPPDRSPKFPTEKLVPKGEKSFNHLVKLCRDGMTKRGLDGKQEYTERLLEELNVIKQMKNSDYFISYQKIMELARKVTLTGPARGSGGGSLVAYVLFITDLDPIRWELPFARFLSVYRVGAPDIDCLRSDHVINTIDGFKELCRLEVGDQIYDHQGDVQEVTFVHSRQQKNDELCFEFLVKKEDSFGTIVCSEHHRLLTNESNDVYAKNVEVGDTLYKDVRVLHKRVTVVGQLTDISVSNSHTFQCVPFDVIEKTNSSCTVLVHVNTYIDSDGILEDIDTRNCWETRL
jgi:hypothetical protein